MRILVFGDLHLTPGGGGRAEWHAPFDFAGARVRLATIFERAVDLRPDLIAVLGDLTHHGDRETLAEAVDLLAAAPAPLRLVPGNHDYYGKPSAFARAFEGAEGVARLAAPGGERFGGWTVAAVPFDLAGAGEGEVESASALLPPEPLPGPLVLLSHYPPVSLHQTLQRRGLQDAGALANEGQLVRALNARGDATVALAGHLHVRDSAVRGSLLQLSVAAQVEPPHEFAVVDLDRESDELRARRTAVSLGDAAAPAAIGPVRESWRFGGTGWTPSP